MSALRPAVKRLVDKNIPRTAAVFVVYLLFVLFFILLISIIIPPIIFETTNLIGILPIYLQNALPEVNRYVNITDLSRLLPNVTNNIFGIIGVVFSNMFFVVTTMFFGLYFLMQDTIFDDFLTRFLDEEKAERTLRVLHNAEKRMSSWFWGELALMTIVGVFTYIGLNLIGIKYSLPLAVLAGLLEVVPNIGPIISAIPAILIGFGTSYFQGFAALALSVIVQQLENSLFVPLIMRKAVGINPIFTLVALIVGGRIGGILGVLLAIPLFLFAEAIFVELVRERKKEKKENAEIIR